MAYGQGQANPPYHAVPAGQDLTSACYSNTGPFGTVPSGPFGTAPFGPVNPDWLAASADRERTVGALRAGFTEGRLTQDELDDRIARAYAARTYADLWALVADLPSGPLPYPPGYPVAAPFSQNPAVPPSSSPPSNWGPAAALIITALVIFTLAALVTAIATAHAQPMPLQQFQHANLAPFITQVGGTRAGP